MNPDQFETRDLMEEMILREVRRLSEAADVTAFVRYADATLKGGPLDFVLVDPELPDCDASIPISFAFQGLGIWFICRRYGETFHMRHVIVEIDEAGRFSRGQVGEVMWIQGSVVATVEALGPGIILIPVGISEEESKP